jgi:ABC-type sugar transport system substrate-binding protein
VVPTDSDASVPALGHAASPNVPVVAIDIGPAGGETAMIAPTTCAWREACRTC